MAADENEGGAGACGHANAQSVGAGGNATYLLCPCGVVLVAQGGRVWALPARAS